MWAKVRFDCLVTASVRRVPELGTNFVVAAGGFGPLLRKLNWSSFNKLGDVEGC